MNRDDISDFLIHWTSGNTYQESFDALFNIILEKKIYGNSRYIKGGHQCICFTERPAKYFPFEKRYYKPFGIGLTKKYLFGIGGRPVIYGLDKEYNDLSEKNRWRHVHYDPCSDTPIDFTWEREWRINDKYLSLDSREVLIIVPSSYWSEMLVDRFYHEEFIRYQWECIGYGDELAEPPENFLYNIMSF